jgi:hypothetical protein
MENSRNKSFVSLKLCALLCSIIKSHLSWDMSDPFVQCIHTVYTTHPLDASQSSHNQIDCQGITALRIHKVQYNTRLQASTGELGSCPLTIKVEVLLTTQTVSKCVPAETHTEQAHLPIRQGKNPTGLAAGIRGRTFTRPSCWVWINFPGSVQQQDLFANPDGTQGSYITMETDTISPTGHPQHFKDTFTTSSNKRSASGNKNLQDQSLDDFQSHLLSIFLAARKGEKLMRPQCAPRCWCVNS